MKGTKDRDNRRFKRYDVDGIGGSLIHNHKATVLNMSLTGMALETTAKLGIGGVYQLRLSDHKTGELSFPAKVMWCHLVRTERSEGGDVRPVYQAGVDFRDVLDEKAHQMLHFIEDNIVVELERRIFGRFKLQDDSAVELASDGEFAVRRISLSGMLIETGQRPEREELLETRIDLGEAAVEVVTRVVDVRGGKGEDGLFEVGLEFITMDDASRKRLEGFIERLIE